METLFFGSRDCAPIVAAGLGYGAPALGVGRPKTEYIAATPLHTAAFDGLPEDRSRRSNLVDLATREKAYGLVYGSNATMVGPIIFSEKRSEDNKCRELIKKWDEKVGHDTASKTTGGNIDQATHLEPVLDFLENEPEAFETLMCLGLTHAPAGTCVTNPLFRWDMDPDGTRSSDPKTYDGYQQFAGTGTGHNPSASMSIKPCDADSVDGAAINVAGCETGTNQITMGNNRAWYYQTSDFDDDWEDEEHYDSEWLPCEMRTREQCGKAKHYKFSQDNTGDNDVTEATAKECVMSSPLPSPPSATEADADITDINPYKIHSLQYLADKTGLDANKLLCRYYGDTNSAILYGNDGQAGAAAVTLRCDTAAYAHGASRPDLAGGNPRTDFDSGRFTIAYDTTESYGAEHSQLIKVSHKDDDADGDLDALTKDDPGGDDFMHPRRHDKYILNDRSGSKMYTLEKEDVEFLAAYVATTYAYLIDTAERYNELEGDGEVTSDALASRESLLANTRGDCFSPGLSGGGLLYQGGFGAAYFAFGIILIVCHLLWLMYAVGDDESKRFMATRAMSLFGILTALAGLYSTFTWPKHQCHPHPKHFFPLILIHTSIPVRHQQFSSSSTAVDRAKFTTRTSSGGLRVSSETAIRMKPRGSLGVSTMASSRSLTTIRALPYVLDPYPSFHGTTFFRF